jgi:hypothetical protein
MAAIPKDRSLIAMTVCDRPNFETEIAGRLAKAVGSSHILLKRDNEYYANQAFDAIRMSGGDPTFLDAHFLGFRREILSEGLEVILGGLFSDLLLKGHFCSEPMTLFNRSLPRNRVRRVPGSAEQWIKDQRKRDCGHMSWAFRKGVLAKVDARHQHQFSEIEKLRKDGSAAEWIEFWQSPTWNFITNISVHRRILPKTEVFCDKRILKMSAIIPQKLKVNAVLFRKSILPILGSMGDIPHSSTRFPVSTPPLAQFVLASFNKITEKMKRVLHSKSGCDSLFTDGSWINRDWYWRNSIILKQMTERYSLECPPFLRQLLDTSTENIFKSEVPLGFKYRLLHLCIWDAARKVDQ